MLITLPTLYEDELVYSWMSRFSNLIGYRSYYDINNTLLNRKEASHNIYFPSYLSTLIEIFPQEWNINEEYIINNHSLLPIIKPFKTKKSYSSLVNRLNVGSSNVISNMMGANLYSPDGKPIIKICPECSEEYAKNNMDIHLNRYHQIPGVFACFKHRRLLEIYEIPIFHQRYKLYHLDELEKPKMYLDDKFIMKHITLSEDLQKILKGTLDKLSMEEIREKYINRLKEKGYFKSSKMDRKNIIEDFIRYHGEHWLHEMNCYPDDNEYLNWISWIYTKNSSKMTIDPVKHVLFMQFLFDRIEDFSSYEYEHNIFGNGPWPCLNPVAPHYRKRVIQDVEIKFNERKKIPIGEFKCSCGFIYTRQYSLNNEADEYVHSSIKKYGDLWHNTLKDHIISGKTINEICRVMKSSHPTVAKYAQKLGLKHMLKTKINNHRAIDVSTSSANLLHERKEILEEYIKHNNNATITEVRKDHYLEYTYVYKKDEKWIKSRFQRGIRKYNKVDRSEYWSKLDNEICSKIEKAAIKIREANQPTRITKNSLSRELGELRIIYENKLIKMPKTRKAVNKVLESREGFKNRIK